MGNLLALQEKVVKVMKVDGKILEYKPPIRVHQLLSEYTHHAISDQLPVLKYMHPNAEMIRGRMYYLIPLPVSPPSVKKKKKKTVRFSDNLVDEIGQETGAVRIKLVISKQDLQNMLREGAVSADKMISQMQKETKPKKGVTIESENGCLTSKASLPDLETISEVN
ncbi:hypothetical protein F511_37081 [Dorcoceras hygrometricum]|uniref:Uncharacterized protein n=1 Tax=Dorcoceras hygrometricum TaxID=472368 RepID=A0A2Z7CI99_9LAMI|nr:hypothetical protein F511_37081 [Dorcoceras hygrometricum]